MAASICSEARSLPRRLASHRGDAQHVGGAGRAERDAGHHDHAAHPALAKPSLNAMRQARSTMSSWSWASSVTTQCTPHTTASRRRGLRDARALACGRQRWALGMPERVLFARLKAGIFRVRHHKRTAKNPFALRPISPLAPRVWGSSELRKHVLFPLVWPTDFVDRHHRHTGARSLGFKRDHGRLVLTAR